MANVVLTNICNLSCPYCFASDMRTQKTEYVTCETFDRITTFLLKSHSREIGLIGGEPTLHPNFLKLLSKSAQLFQKVFVYTNGINLEHFFPYALDDNICYLVNVNEASIMGDEQFDKMEHMLYSAAKLGMFGQFALGVNIYDCNQKFDDILRLCEKFRLNALRVSLVVPNNSNFQRSEWFMRLKPSLLRLYRELSLRGVIAKYDCNIVPPCFFTEHEKNFIRTLPGSLRDRMRLMGEISVCRPVIDILIYILI